MPDRSTVHQGQGAAATIASSTSTFVHTAGKRQESAPPLAPPHEPSKQQAQGSSQQPPLHVQSFASIVSRSNASSSSAHGGQESRNTVSSSSLNSMSSSSRAGKSENLSSPDSAGAAAVYPASGNSSADTLNRSSTPRTDRSSRDSARDPQHVQDLLNSGRAAHTMALAIGADASVATINGLYFDGVLSSCDGKGDVIMGDVSQVCANGNLKKETICFNKDDVVMTTMRNVPVHFNSPKVQLVPSGTPPGDLQTDVQLAQTAKYASQQPRELTPWVAEDGNEHLHQALGAGRGSNSTLSVDEMFRKHQAQHNVKSTYDHSLKLYMVPIERSNTEEFRRMERDATRIAAEMEANPVSHHYNDEDPEDEEGAYSAVNPRRKYSNHQHDVRGGSLGGRQSGLPAHDRDRNSNDGFQPVNRNRPREDHLRNSNMGKNNPNRTTTDRTLGDWRGSREARNPRDQALGCNVTTQGSAVPESAHTVQNQSVAPTRSIVATQPNQSAPQSHNSSYTSQRSSTPTAASLPEKEKGIVKNAAQAKTATSPPPPAAVPQNVQSFNQPQAPAAVKKNTIESPKPVPRFQRPEQKHERPVASAPSSFPRPPNPRPPEVSRPNRSFVNSNSNPPPPPPHRPSVHESRSATTGQEFVRTGTVTYYGKTPTPPPASYQSSTVYPPTSHSKQIQATGGKAVTRTASQPQDKTDRETPVLEKNGGEAIVGGTVEQQRRRAGPPRSSLSQEEHSDNSLAKSSSKLNPDAKEFKPRGSFQSHTPSPTGSVDGIPPYRNNNAYPPSPSFHPPAMQQQGGQYGSRQQQQQQQHHHHQQQQQQQQQQQSLIPEYMHPQAAQAPPVHFVPPYQTSQYGPVPVAPPPNYNQQQQVSHQSFNVPSVMAPQPPSNAQMASYPLYPVGGVRYPFMHQGMSAPGQGGDPNTVYINPPMYNMHMQQMANMNAFGPMLYQSAAPPGGPYQSLQSTPGGFLYGPTLPPNGQFAPQGMTSSQMPPHVMSYMMPANNPYNQQMRGAGMVQHTSPLPPAM